MSTFEKTETKVATSVGFHGGRRLRVGDTFRAPASLKGQWFTSAASDPKGAKAALDTKFNVLEMTAPQVKEVLGDLTNDEIASAIDAEMGSQKRKNVLAMLNDERANRVGQIGGPDPAAKKPEEDDLMN
jgi:hypothetical protein